MTKEKETAFIIPGEMPDDLLHLPEELDFDPYLVVEAVFHAHLEALQLSGWLRRPSETTCQWELDDHLDDLTDLYKQTCRKMGLAFPPPPIDYDEKVPFGLES